ncbi:MAG: hypothetical protein ACI8W8_001173 [Rhodothermales bacterium]|jgi:hypothetical protein
MRALLDLGFGAPQGGARKIFCRWREPPVDAFPNISTRPCSHVIIDHVSPSGRDARNSYTGTPVPLPSQSCIFLGCVFLGSNLTNQRMIMP